MTHPLFFFPCDDTQQVSNWYSLGIMGKRSNIKTWVASFMSWNACRLRQSRNNGSLTFRLGGLLFRDHPRPSSDVGTLHTSFAQNWTVITYLRVSKGSTFIIPIRWWGYEILLGVVSNYLFIIYFLWWANLSGSLWKRKTGNNCTLG